jgi:hypothetical protein
VFKAKLVHKAQQAHRVKLVLKGHKVIKVKADLLVLKVIEEI